MCNFAGVLYSLQSLEICVSTPFYLNSISSSSPENTLAWKLTGKRSRSNIKKSAKPVGKQTVGSVFVCFCLFACLFVFLKSKCHCHIGKIK